MTRAGATPSFQLLSQAIVPQKRVLLLSGGLDSTTLLANLLRDTPSPHALFVDYGQPAAINESNAARAICDRYAVPLHEVSVSGLAIPRGGEISGRNALLATVGLMSASTDPTLILLAIHAGTGYADCTSAFMDGQQRIFDLYTSGRVVLSAPFLTWSKGDIWVLGKSLGIPADVTYSCELGLAQPCGDCRSCRDLEALREAS